MSRALFDDTRLLRWLFAAAGAIALGGCDNATVTSDPECREHTDCQPEEICREGTCRRPCLSDANCPPEQPRCVHGVCLEVATACRDREDCVTPPVCHSATAAVCDAGRCVYPSVRDDTPCADVDPCTTDERCRAGACVGDPVICATPPDPSCTGDDATYIAYASYGICDPGTGACAYAARTVPCASCSTTCLHVCDAVTCADQNGGCLTQGTCLPPGGTCEYVTRADGSACTFGSGTGSCVRGLCVECVNAAQCQSPPGGRSECYTASCQGNSCTYAPNGAPGCEDPQCAGQPAETPCNDANPCTYDDACTNAGLCLGTAITCANDPQTCGAIRTCNGTNACTVTYPGSETGCDDGNLCSYGDRCQSGSCLPTGTVSCTNGAPPCGAQRACNGTALCDVTYPTGACTDNNACTYGDHCATGTCVPDGTVSCTDDPGTCGARRSCNGTPDCAVTYPTGSCTDNNPCTYGDHCAGGACVVDGTVTCTSDPGQCGTQRFCNNTPSCGTSTPSSCDDGNLCTYGDYCSGTTCVGGTTVSCTNEPPPCGAQRSCNGTSSCSVTYPTVSCNDGDACSYNDRCQSGVCDGTTVTCTNGTPPCGVQRSCNGTASCTETYPGTTVDCGTCRRCDGSGGCAVNSTDHGDCPTCQKCVSGGCQNQTAGEDLKDECTWQLYTCSPSDFCSGTGASCGALAEYSQCDGDGLMHCMGGYCQASCPFIFARRGGGWEYVTDDAGNALGMMRKHALAKSLVQFFGPHYIMLGQLDRDPDGLYRVKLRETLQELDYVDELKLVAIDHPAGSEVIASSAEQRIEDRRLYLPTVKTVRAPRPLRAATDWLGRDVTAEARELDGVPVPSDPAAPRHYTFDFGPIPEPAHAKLVLDAWSMFGKDFVSEQKVRGHLLVVDRSGAWVRVRDIGFPQGDAKRLAIDLGDLFLSDDQRIRVHTGTGPGGRARWTIDRALLDTSAPEPTVVRELPAQAAYLGHKGGLSYTAAGYHQRIRARDNRLGTLEYHLSFGDFTRFGAVTELLGAQDNHFVIMQHGDELTAAFADPGEPGPGMVRSWALRSTLFYKQHYRDRDVEPLPFWGMTADPPRPDERYPDEEGHRAYRAAYNTRRYREDGRRETLTAPRGAPLPLAIGAAQIEPPAAIGTDALIAQLATALAPARNVTRVAVERAEAELTAVATGAGELCQLTLVLTERATGETMAAASVDTGCDAPALARAAAEAVRQLGLPPVTRTARTPFLAPLPRWR